MTLATRATSTLAVINTADGWHVHASRTESYPIHLGDGLITRLDELLTPVLGHLQVPRIVVVADEGVTENHMPAVTTVLRKLWTALSVTVIPAGEASKSVDGLVRVWEALQAAEATRRTLIVGLGGGMVCDLVTVAAATYMRGLPYALVPTTVLAQLDAAIGGKGALDWAGTKNLLGAFYHPAVVVIDPELTRTLPDTQVRNGLAEAIKVALIADAELFTLLETATYEGFCGPRLSRIVHAAVAAKLSLLAPDPFEFGDLRRLLNLGHCLGHPLEAATKYRMPHGDAVAAGTAVAAALAHQAGHSSTADRDRILGLLAACRLPTTMPFSLRDEVWRGMHSVRRIRNGLLHVVLPVRPGHCVVQPDLDRRAFDRALAELDGWEPAP